MPRGAVAVAVTVAALAEQAAEAPLRGRRTAARMPTGGGIATHREDQ